MFRRFASLLRSGLKRVSEVLLLHDEPPPEEATSLLLTLRSDRKLVFLGSCFAYSSPHVFLRAAHCIRDSASSALCVSCATEDTPDKYLLIRQVITHPTADLAVLIADPSDSDFTPYREVLEIEPGDEVHAYGFHEDTTNHGIEPLDRYFHGVAQRLFTWDIQKPYSYDAIELSFGAPPGLSGGPLYKSFLLERSGTHYFLVGMVTGNREVSIHLETTTEVQEGSQHYIERIHSVTNYGIALNLAAYTKWLTKTCKGAARPN
jgi:S1-C subfamily serine protease